MTTSVLAIGDLAVDLILGRVAALPKWGQEIEVDSLETRLGGNVGNFAVAARSIGLQLSCAGPVGADENGARVRRDLESIGCGTQLVHSVVGASTCVSVGFVHDDGERMFITYSGALRGLAEFVRQIDPPATDVAFLSGWCQPPRIDTTTLVKFLETLNAQRTSTVIDLSWSDETWRRKNELLQALRLADFVLLNGDELAAIVGHRDVDKGLDALSVTLGDRPAIIVKRGAEGAAAKKALGKIVKVPAPSASTESTVGAGDAFNAAFIAATFERHLDLAAAIDFACRFASRVVKEGRQHLLQKSSTSPGATHSQGR